MAPRTQTEIDAAITKRRRRSMLKAEQESLLQIGKRKPKADRPAGDNRKPQRAKRYSEAADFRIPTPMTDRPRAADGASSFHFSYSPVSKQAVPTVGGKPLGGRWTAAGALAHSQYIERDGAAETMPSHEAYLGRAAAVETVNADGLGEAHLNQPSPLELIFTNISDNSFLREEYWRAVERCEREPKENFLTFDPAQSPAWWSALAARTDAPLALTDHVAHIFTADQTVRPLLKCADLPITAERAGSLLRWAQTVTGWDRDEPPLGFKSGRGGRVQNRIVAELPHELDAAGRAEIVARFTTKLADRGAMFTAVVHAPDAHNDKRNYHVHIVAHDRPARWLDDRNLWDFEVSEITTDQHRNTRQTFPFRKNKIAEFAQDKGPRGTIGFVETLRRDFAEISNDVLAASGTSKRYDHRTYKKMGIDRVPTEHLGPKAAALEAVGVPTAVGTLNAVKLWTSAERQVDTERSRTIADIHVASDQASAGFNGDTAQRRALSIQIARRTAAALRAAEIQHSIDLLALLEAKAKSRALKTRDTCLTHLVDIQAGRADRTTTKNASYIRRRFDEAQAHITELEIAFDADLPLLNAMRLDLHAETAKLTIAVQTILHIRAQPRSVPTTPPRASAATQTAVVDSPHAPSPQAKTDLPAAATLPEGPVVVGGLDATRVRPIVSSEPTVTPPIKTGPVSKIPPTLPTSTQGADNGIQGSQERRVSPPVKQLADPLRLAYFAKLAESIAARVGARVLGLSTVGLVSAVRRPAFGPRFHRPEGPIADVLLPAAAHDHLGQNAASDNGMRHEGTGPAGTGSAGRQERPALTPDPNPAPTFEFIHDQPNTPPAKVAKPPLAASRVASDKRWDEVIKEIISRSLYLVELPSPDGSVRFDAPSLEAPDRALLSAERYATRTHIRLQERFKHQNLEITRVVKWLAAIGNDDKNYPTIDGRLSIANAPKHLQTMIARYRGDPAIDAARNDVVTGRNERARAAAAVATASKQARPATPAASVKPRSMTLEELLDAGLESRRKEARERYPDARDAETNELRAFLNALRDAAPEEKLEAAADRVAASPDAAAEVMRHGHHLATAYHRFAAETLARQAERARSARQDFGRSRTDERR